MLQKDACDRLTLEAVRLHPWTNAGYAEPPPAHSRSSVTAITSPSDIDDELVGRMEAMGFERESIVQSLLSGKLDMHGNVYQLLMEKRQREMAASCASALGGVASTSSATRISACSSLGGISVVVTQPDAAQVSLPLDRAPSPRPVAAAGTADHAPGSGRVSPVRATADDHLSGSPSPQCSPRTKRSIMERFRRMFTGSSHKQDAGCEVPAATANAAAAADARATAAPAATAPTTTATAAAAAAVVGDIA